MIVDIRKDVPDFMAYIRQRVAEQAVAPKKSGAPDRVSRIDFGFEFGQGNELWLVFDTRPDAEPDGEWTLQVSNVPSLKRPDWPVWHELPEDEAVHFIDLGGSEVDVMENPDEMICEIVGEAMKHALVLARDEGVFDALPKAERCEMGVENMEGFYGWPMYEDRGRENLV